MNELCIPREETSEDTIPECPFENPLFECIFIMEALRNNAQQDRFNYAKKLMDEVLGFQP